MNFSLKECHGYKLMFMQFLYLLRIQIYGVNLDEVSAPPCPSPSTLSTHMCTHACEHTHTSVLPSQALMFLARKGLLLDTRLKWQRRPRWPPIFSLGPVLWEGRFYFQAQAPNVTETQPPQTVGSFHPQVSAATPEVHVGKRWGRVGQIQS